MSNPFIGEIVMFAGNFAPRNWAMCNGQLLPISQNAALFSILGTTYGGNGVNTFALPDLRGRAPVHAGQGPGLSNYVLGESIGTENVTLLTNNMPIHVHQLALACSSSGGNQATPGGNYPAVESTGTSANYSSTPDSNMAPQNTGQAGSSQPLSIIQPVLAVNFIIALFGIFPSRN